LSSQVERIGQGRDLSTGEPSQVRTRPAQAGKRRRDAGRNERTNGFSKHHHNHRTSTPKSCSCLSCFLTRLILHSSLFIFTTFSTFTRSLLPTSLPPLLALTYNLTYVSRYLLPFYSFPLYFTLLYSTQQHSITPHGSHGISSSINTVRIIHQFISSHLILLLRSL